MTPEKLPVEHYETQLAEKVTRLQQLMAPFSAPEIEVFRSPVSHYRMRAEFRIWHDGDDLYHIIFDQQTRQRIRVDQFPAASELINQMMPLMIAAIRNHAALRRKLFQIDYLSTMSNQIVISLLYHRKLDEAWQQAAEALRDALRAQGFDVQLIGRATKTKICLDRDYVDERLPVAGREMIYRQIENSFTQPNAAMNIQMLEWALDVTKNAQGDLLELYCGNGNFSLALARNFRRVLATEIAKPSVAAAQYNIAANQIDNVQIIRMAAEEFTQAMNGVRAFNRLEGIDLQSYQCETIFVDPPRSGLDEETVKLVQGYPQILYISCNPQTLCDNLATLAQTHAVTRLALFDQFPYTHHMECGVLLTRR
ncbi:MAG: tRNA (uridine(54)-C5)-methyltransferase TrmA [Mixta calida]|uniref:tRNA/tmRNA (uracil-C(5))-methyltransferase n=1 Tax=Mixta calida TaxID=665913 RepID=A0ABN5HFM6_9GAMM|nr:tRNA (uridine(54)-C5)-methyltransferase TrmA [Mixta calida]AIX75247.1 tRNA (uracil-5-)-methyltransferase [Pantoea sp. PSNIH2]MBS6060033.1 tRNA (uridine(54)-C5)-methyltransferase TrmA [Pantoea sp.]POU44400.1 tRNA (uridine(54)-C5)-methyltransferase TrmA [Pantoea sp. PSNIH5]POU63280.1 tRNA (uridine(54)-C5)-methyltransferase TrmA [Pantoea sp. PSNIH4]POY66730.1 tRNA (uridine(54)-C5)-methyltransferase TrmA [Pantoea sp. PSNIH3]HCW45958.1 tRNA (uridine(54)-C5)-methyltransferase TrmA [Erwiniaceae b